VVASGDEINDGLMMLSAHYMNHAQLELMSWTSVKPRMQKHAALNMMAMGCVRQSRRARGGETDRYTHVVY
jgi:hypothetical protein